MDIYVKNKSAQTYHFPYHGDSPPWHKSNWYVVEVDGIEVIPDDPAIDHQDNNGTYPIQPFDTGSAHRIVLANQSIENVFREYRALYRLEEGKHTIRVLPSPLWQEQHLPQPVPSTIDIHIKGDIPN